MRTVKFFDDEHKAKTGNPWTREGVEHEAPWAAHIVKTGYGFIAFESHDDHETYRNQA